jgi:hypothetical protein
MKLQKKIMVLTVLLIAQLSFAHQENHQATEESVTVVTTKAHACHCRPTEHWLYKVCVQNYMVQFPNAGLKVSQDSEELPANIVQAIAMLAANLNFFDGNGDLILPKIKAEKVTLPMAKNPTYKLCKMILHDVDTTTTLSAQELYESWLVQLHDMQVSQ